MTALAVLTRFRLPDWAHRTFVLAAPGRPLAPRPDAVARGLSLCPASAVGLVHADPVPLSRRTPDWTPWAGGADLEPEAA